jgi:hypothetical protein
MRWRGLAQSRGTVPPISQRPLRRSTTYQGQERSQCSGRPDHRVARGSPRRGSGLPLCQQAGVSPKPGGAEYFLSRWLRAFFSPNDRGFPQAKGSKFSLCRMAQSFLPITQLGVSPPPRKSKFSPSPWPRASFSAHDSGFPPAPHTLKFSLCRWPEVHPCGLPSCQVAPGFSKTLRPQNPPNAGWLGVSPSPVTIPGGEEISTPISRDCTRGFRQQFQDSLAVHKPSTVNPGLSPATDVSPPGTPQDGPQAGLLWRGRRISRVPDIGRRT